MTSLEPMPIPVPFDEEEGEELVSESSRIGKIANLLLQILLLPVNFLIWLLSSPELMTLLCILSEILIELVVSAIMAGVSLIVSAVILLEDEPEQSSITSEKSDPCPPKSFLRGGEDTCPRESIRDSVRKSVDKPKRPRGTSTKTLGFLDSLLPKFGAPIEEKKKPATSESDGAELVIPDTAEPGSADETEPKPFSLAEIDDNLKDALQQDIDQVEEALAETADMLETTLQAAEGEAEAVAEAVEESIEKVAD